jgi:cytoskeletal protein CcmA (bactofilin family)
MKISGSGRLSEGVINDKLSVSGSARIEGNFECDEFRSSGSLRGSADLVVHGDVRSSGSFRIIGSLFGDGNAKSSGSMSVGGQLSVKGTLVSSGSLKVGNKVEALEGIRFSGSSRIQGDLLSQKDINIDGSTTIGGNIKGDNVFIGRDQLLYKKGFKQPYKLQGNIFAEKQLDIIGTYVAGDVRGRDVKIGRKTEILGAVYYIDSIEVHKQATLTNDPIQITVDHIK